MTGFLTPLQKNIFQTSLSGASSVTNKADVFFCLDFDEKGAFIQVTDKHGNEINPDFHSYSNETFSVLRTLATIREKNQFVVSWEGGNKHVYLDEYDYLMYQLIHCKNLTSNESKPISLSPERATICLEIKKEDKTFVTKFCLKMDNGMAPDFRFLTDSFVICEQTIYQTEPVGEGYKQMSVFTTHFDERMLETFLSVFFSYMQHIQVIYENYKIIESGEEVQTTPALIFEKVDEDKALYLRMENALPQMDNQLLEQFDLIRMAQINELENKIILKRIIRQPLEPHLNQLNKTILQYATGRGGKKSVFQDGNFFIIPQEIAGPFVLNCLPALAGEYIILGADKLKEYKVKVYKPSLHVSLSSGIDFLEGEATLAFGNEQISLADALRQFRKKRYILLADENKAVVDEVYMRKLERLFHKSGDGKKIKLSFFDLPEVEELIEERTAGESFVKSRAIYEGFNKLASARFVQPEVNAVLRNYQKEGVKWINYLYENKLGGCLADDMGLGKTIQALTMLARIYPKTKQPTLIIMPKSLLFNWQNEIERFTPQLSSYIYYGNTRDLDQAMKQAQLILTTYALLRNDAEKFSKKKFHYVILDESQHIKNLNAQTTQAVMLLNAPHRLALSGTPVENNLTELYSLFRFLNPTMFGSADEFNMAYTYPIQKDNDKAAIQSLRRKIYPFMLRRLKKDVLKELPDRMEQTLYVEMTSEQQQFYEQRRMYYYQHVKETIETEGLQKSQFIMFQALNELRRIASVPESMSDGTIPSPKLDLLLDYLTEVVANNRKAIVFFNYIAGIELVSEKLNEEGIDFVCMTGSTHDRQKLVERFQTDPECKVFLMTIKTGGVGLNLTAADTVFIFEPWWNKAVEEQAINRVHRIGQTNKVQSYSIITRQSIEEKIRALQLKKAELFENLIGNDSASPKSLSEEDINFILG